MQPPLPPLPIAPGATRRSSPSADGDVRGGGATRVPFALPTEILRERLDDFTLVDDAIRDAIRRTVAAERILMEGAAATGVAATLAVADELAKKTGVFPISGQNLSDEKFRSIVAAQYCPCTAHEE